MAVADPASLFDSQEFSSTGTVVWTIPTRKGIGAYGVSTTVDQATLDQKFGLGQILVNKRAAWDAIYTLLAMSEHCEEDEIKNLTEEEKLKYALMAGGVTPASSSRPAERVGDIIVQYGTDNTVLFERKHQWDFFATDKPGYAIHGRRCLKILDELRSKWDGGIRSNKRLSPVVLNEHPHRQLILDLISSVW